MIDDFMPPDLRHIIHLMPYWGIFSILIEIYRSPLVYVIIHDYGIHARSVFDFILSGYSEEPLLSHSTRFVLFDIVVIPRWNYFRCLGFPRHHFSGVHIRSVMRPTVLFSGYQDRSGTSDAILGHISLI
ncbi:hypothetical protein VitviT2T_006736 [Vitis vinifera]|uniref:Uncharacterized protein n=1 Tax=Vitis vinifera TaxID=29760 RepID=A0ABY9BX02_VITVI|nr:hypothetical protein VitviT2T_006736 [Vitis vinifera]